MAGLFITIEGIEGCGKTTQIELLEYWLTKRRRAVVKVFEPGGTAIGDRLREILLDPDSVEMNHRAEALIYAASRAQLVAEKIRGALKEDKIVLCDRYIDSSLAYQVYGRGLNFQTVLSINEWATDGLMPDLTFLLRLPAELGLGRTAGRVLDRLEREDLRFHKQVEAGYEDLAVKYAERYSLIDGRDPAPEVHKHVVAKVEELIQ